MMFSAHIEDALIEVESHFNDMSRALVSGEPLALGAASAALRQGAIDFSELLQRLTPIELKSRDLKLRLKTLSDGMAVRRECLIRRTVLVERALNAIVPATCSTTYSQAAGPYGNPGKQTGAFKVLAA
jgi:hypothetical protein